MLVDEVLHQHRNVLDAFAQRRNDDGDDVQAVVEIVFEPALVHELAEVAVGRRDYADVYLLRPFGAERFDFTLLQYPKQLGLQRRRSWRRFRRERSTRGVPARTCPSSNSTRR